MDSINSTTDISICCLLGNIIFLPTRGSYGRFHDAAACFRMAWLSSAEGADISSHQYLCWEGLNAAAKVLRMIRCGGGPPPSPNQYLITNKVKEMSSKVTHHFEPQQTKIYLVDTLANFWNCFYYFSHSKKLQLY